MASSTHSRWGSILSNVTNVVQQAAAQAVDVMAPVMQDYREAAEGESSWYEDELDPQGEGLVYAPRKGGAEEEEEEEEEGHTHETEQQQQQHLPPSVTVRRSSVAAAAAGAGSQHRADTHAMVDVEEEEEEDAAEDLAAPRRPSPYSSSPSPPTSPLPQPARRPSPTPHTHHAQDTHTQTQNNLHKQQLEQQQRQFNQLRFRVEALESERAQLAQALQEREASLESSTREWQAIAREQQAKEKQTLSSLLGAAEEMGALIGDRQNSQQLFVHLTKMKKALQQQAQSPREAKYPVKLLQEASAVLQSAIRTAVEERASLFNGLAEVLDERPPPREVNEVLSKLEEAIMAAGAAAAGAVPSENDAKKEAEREEREKEKQELYTRTVAALEQRGAGLEKLCAELEAELRGVSANAVNPAVLQAKEAELTEFKRKCQVLEEEVQTLRRERSVTPSASVVHDKEKEKAEADELRRRCASLEERMQSMKEENSKGGNKTPLTPPMMQALKQETKELQQRCRALEEELETVRQQQQQQRSRSRSRSSSTSSGTNVDPAAMALIEAEAQELRNQCKALETEKAALAERVTRQEQELTAAVAAAAAAAKAAPSSTPPHATTITTPPTATAAAGPDLAPELARVKEEASQLKTLLQTHKKEAQEWQAKEKAAQTELTRATQQLTDLQRKQQEQAKAKADEEVARAKKRTVEEEARLREKEHEVNQLRVVIEQQRGLVRAKADELDKARREGEENKRRLEAAEAMVNGLVMEKNQHLHSMRAAEAKGHGMAEIQEHVAELEEALETTRAATAEAEADYKGQVQELHTRLQQAEHAAHDMGAQLAAARADMGVLGRDYEQSETARGNLQKVLEQFQWEKDAELKHIERQHQKALEAQEEATKTREEHLRKSLQGQIEDAHTQALLATESAEMEKVKAKAQTDQAKKEALSLRKALDEAIHRLHSNESDVVQRQLIGNLMVSYFSQGRPKETLEIIARTLGFTDAERVKVGLRALHGREGGGEGGGGAGAGGGSGMSTPSRPKGGGVIGGLFSRVGGMVNSPRKEYVPEEGVEGKTLGDLWLDYLMKETEEENVPSPPDLASLVELPASVGGMQPPAPPQEEEAGSVGGGVEESKKSQVTA